MRLHTKYLSFVVLEFFLSFSCWLPQQPEFCMELNSLNFGSFMQGTSQARFIAFGQVVLEVMSFEVKC
jgi:hypothetical protein